MEYDYERIREFIAVCDELIAGSFALAEEKIKQALRAVASSRALTELFTAVAEGYDYPKAKAAYLRAAGGRGRAYLPSGRREILAFVFCVLVELDAGTLRLNDFLLRYFYVDGSYTASFAVFTEKMLRPFRDIVKDCFPELEKKTVSGQKTRARDELLEKIAEKIGVEHVRVARLNLYDEERIAADALLNELLSAANRRDVNELLALLAGYKYLLRYIHGECEESEAIFNLCAEL